MPSASAAGSAPGHLLQGAVDVEPRESKRRHQTEQECRSDRNHDEVTQHAVVHRVVEDSPGRPAGTTLCERIGPHAPSGNPPAANRSHARQHQAFDEQLPDDPPPACTQRDAD